MFQPSMLGLEQAGISETIQFVLGKFSAEEQQRLVQVECTFIVSSSKAYRSEWCLRLQKN
jgi:hypothetical protein